MPGEKRGSRGSGGSLGPLLIAVGPGYPAGPSASFWHWILLGGNAGGLGSLKAEKDMGKGSAHGFTSLLHLQLPSWGP